MAESLSGPVGLRWRTQRVASRAQDQDKIIGLLASISSSQGGKKEAWPARPLSCADGDCPQFLADAIWEFQSHWKRQGLFHNIDGVVDPGGNTLKQLNRLAGGGSGPGPIPPGPDPVPPEPPKPKKDYPIDPTIGVLDSLFTYSTPWTFTGSAGLGGGALGMTGGGGYVDVRNTQNPLDGGRIDFIAGGGGLGLNGVDYGFSFSTSSMWSTGLGKIRARTPQPLTLEDMKGPLAIVSFAGITGATANRGLTLTIYMLGLPGLVMIGNLMVPGALHWIGSSAGSCRAIGVMAGEGAGADVGMAIMTGYGW